MFVLLLLGCAVTWLDRPYACESDVLDWWEPDPAWLVGQAQRDDDGTWQFNAPSGYAGVAHIEGFWDPDGERFGYTEFAVEESSQARVDVSATGSIQPDGELDLVSEVYAYDDLGFLGAWTETITRDGCDMERVAVAVGDTTENVYRYDLRDDHGVAGSFTYAPAGSDAAWEENFTVNINLVYTSLGGWDDGSYRQEVESGPDGERDVLWEDHADAASGWITYGEDHYALDGTRLGTTREEHDGVVDRTCEIDESYAGLGVATCFEPAEARRCTFRWDAETCAGTCDDGSVPEC